MKHEHKCDDCRNMFDCQEEDLSESECELEELPICEDCR